MKQICTFNTRPETVNHGGYKKGHWVMWLNLSVTEIEATETEPDVHFKSMTDRLVLTDRSVAAFLDEVDPAHLSEATVDELTAILRYLQAEDDVDAWKALRKMQIQGYDSSAHVNCFYLDEVPMWLDKATRVGLVNSISIEKQAGHESTCLWFGTTKISMGVDTALEALSQLELYALACYNVTAQHLAQLNQCVEVDDVRLLDISADYPNKLHIHSAE